MLPIRSGTLDFLECVSGLAETLTHFVIDLMRVTLKLKSTPTPSILFNDTVSHINVQ